ncbi:MAG TPA: hypothetical protein VMT90_00365 [Dehalococcoidia bacterium]|nr:hypothetical protein [Dehalococcoidia bacterium]
MAVENKSLVLDLVEWVAKQPRSYAEVMDVWRTSCPRFPIWEDAVEHGLVSQAHGDGVVEVTPAGLDLLRSERGAARAPDATVVH